MAAINVDTCRNRDGISDVFIVVWVTLPLLNKAKFIRDTISSEWIDCTSKLCPIKKNVKNCENTQQLLPSD